MLRGPDDQTCYLVDWNAPNVTDDHLDDLIDEADHALLRIPGCTTDHVQGNDTHMHKPFSGNYKDREIANALEQLQLGYAMAKSDKQTILNRAAGADGDLNHAKLSHSFVANGIAGDLHGGDDDRLTSTVAPFWHACGMKEKREQIRDWVCREVTEGRITEFRQYKELLKEYPHMRILPEGSEAYEWENGGDEDDENEAGVETDEDAEPPLNEDIDLQEPAAEAEALEPGTDAGGSQAVPRGALFDDSASKPGAFVEPAEASRTVAEECVADEDAGQAVAAKALWSEKDEQSLNASTVALAALRKEGGDAVADEVLCCRITSLRKKKNIGVAPGAVSVRRAALDRESTQAEERAKVRARHHEVEIAKIDIRKAELEVEKQKADGRAAKVDLRAKESAAREAKETLKARLAHERQQNRERVLNLASETKENIDKFFATKHAKVKLAEAVDKRLSEVKGQLGKRRHAKTPIFFEPQTDILVNLQIQTLGTGKDKILKMSSEQFRWHLFGGKSQDQLKDPNPTHYFRKLLSDALPGYFMLLPFEHHISGLIANARGNFDAAFLEAVWRYGKTLGTSCFPPGARLAELVKGKGSADVSSSRAVASVAVASGAASSSDTRTVELASSSSAPSSTAIAIAVEKVTSASSGTGVAVKEALPRAQESKRAATPAPNSEIKEMPTEKKPKGPT